MIDRRTLLAGGAALVTAPSLLRAQGTWPTRQVRVTIPYPPGGPTDLTTRIIVDRVGTLSGQQFIVENKAGASGAIGAEAAKRAAPDGYNFLAVTTAMLCITPHLQSLPYETKDFVPVARTVTSWVGMGLHPSIPAKNVAEFVAYAKANPGKVNFASAGLATITHLYGELFKFEAGIDMVHVPYKGSNPALQDLLGGQVQIQFDPVTLPQIKAGKLTGLAVLGDKRWPGTPDLPTLKEQGYGKSGGDAWFGLVAPVGTPAPVIERFAALIDEVLRSKEVQDRIADIAHYPSYLSPADFAQAIARESHGFADVIRRGNIKV